jgi:outer membrane protein TolC
LRIIALLLLSFQFAAAQTAPAADDPKFPVPAPLPPFSLPARPGVFAETRLTLKDVVAMVLKNNRDLELVRIDQERANYNILAARGAFDPRIGVDANRLRQVQPVASVLGGSASGKLTIKNQNVDPYLSGLLPWTGTQYKLDFNAARQSTDSTFTTLNPQYPSAATLNLTQPLWRGLRFDQNRYQVSVAQKNSQLTGAQFRQHISDDVTQAVQAYWELDFAWRNLQVQLEALGLARQQDESNRRQVEQGILAAIDVVATHTQIATFEQSVYQGQEILTRAENTLKTLMLADRHDPLWSSALIPATEAGEVPQLAVDASIDSAIKQRAELEQVRISGELNQLETRLAHEETKPEVDMVGTFASSGLAGRTGPVIANPFSNLFPGFSAAPPPLLVGGLGQSLNNAYNGYFPTVQVGVRISMPLRNRTAAANLASSVAQGRRIGVQRQQIEQAIAADVRNSLQATEAARSRLEASILARKSADEQYESEQRQFRAGTSSVFLVLQRQTDLIAARSRELRARADLNEASPLRDRALGTTLQAQNITVR